MSVIKSANTIEKMQEALEVGIKEDSNGDNKSEKCFSILYIYNTSQDLNISDRHC